MKLALQFVLALVLIPLLDFVWLGLLMKNFYMTELGSLVRTENGVFKPLLTAAFVVYILLAAGIVIFALPLARDSGYLSTFLYGAALGFVVYGVYDMTNLSTLQSYSLKLSFVDWAWGTFLCGTAAIITDIVSQKVFPA